MAQYGRWPAYLSPGSAVTSVSASSPLQSSGGVTPNISFINQSANTVLAGPAAGPAAAPTFRALVAADIPLISLTAGVSGVLPEANGGTDQSSYVTGDTLYASSTNNLSKLAIGSTGDVQRVVGGVPSWSPFNDSRNEVTLYDDFIADGTGQLRWSDADTTTGVSATTTTVATSAHPGILELNTGAGATGAATRWMGGVTTGTPTAGFMLGGGALYVEVLVRLEDLATGAEDYNTNFGLNNLIAGATDAVRFLYSRTTSLNWLVDTRSASTTTETDTGVAVVADAWIRLGIQVNAAASSVTFFINGVLVATHSTNIPTVLLVPTLRISKTVGTTPRVAYVDYFKLYQRLTTAR